MNKKAPAGTKHAPKKPLPGLRTPVTVSASMMKRMNTQAEAPKTVAKKPSGRKA